MRCVINGWFDSFTFIQSIAYTIHTHAQIPHTVHSVRYINIWQSRCWFICFACLWSKPLLPPSIIMLQPGWSRHGKNTVNWVEFCRQNKKNIEKPICKVLQIFTAQKFTNIHICTWWNAMQYEYDVLENVHKINNNNDRQWRTFFTWHISFTLPHPFSFVLSRSRSICHTPFAAAHSHTHTFCLSLRHWSKQQANANVDECKHNVT